MGAKKYLKQLDDYRGVEVFLNTRTNEIQLSKKDSGWMICKPGKRELRTWFSLKHAKEWIDSQLDN
jgi:hypothetical protein|tara:strand:- start:74 stop:271 length:198 start_codon:yes stop_codon:yes gene_type:complete